MEGIMKKHPCTSTPSSSPVAMHKESQTISKVGKPKIRIIHIFAPQIIKTDVANFRELVQRLTGKPTTEKVCKKKKKPIRRVRGEKAHQSTSPMLCDKSNKKVVEVRNNGIGGSDLGYGSSNFLGGVRERVLIKEEEEMMWNDNGANSSGGFLGGFADLDVGFIQELGVGGEFPLMFPMDANHHHHHLHGFEETPQFV